MMIKLTIIVLFILCCLKNSTYAQHILFLGAKAHIGNGKVIANSAVAVKEGKFTLVANALMIKIDSTTYDTIIYARNKEIYPGFIAPNSTLGLTEIDAVRATRDFMEVGNYKPHVRAIIAYNTDSDIIPTVRTNGILIF